MRLNRVAGAAITATVARHSFPIPDSTRLMASIASPFCEHSLIFCSTAPDTAGNTMLLSFASSDGSPNTRFATARRSRLPSGRNTGPKASSSARRRDSSVRRSW